MSEKLERVKKHLHDNARVYVVGGVVFVAGVAVGVLATKSEAAQQVTAKISGLINYKPTINQIVEQQLIRRGHPGFRIRNTNTGEEFASITRAAEMYNIARRTLQRHLDGELANAGGHVFENLGEMS